MYDKHEDKFWTTSPVNAFTERDRNTTVDLAGTKSAWIEDLYSRIDGRAAPVLAKIWQSTADQPNLTAFDKMTLGTFMSTLFWRSPAQDELLDRVADTVGFSHGYFNIYKGNTGEPVSDEVQKNFLSDENMRKAYRHALTMIPQLDMSRLGNHQKWQFYFQSPSFNITGDNPLIHRTNPEVESLLDEFIFPLASNCLVVCSDSVEPQHKSPSWGMDLSLAIIHQAQRFVCGHREDFLRALIEHYKEFGTYWSKSDYLSEIFA